MWQDVGTPLVVSAARTWVIRPSTAKNRQAPSRLEKTTAHRQPARSVTGTPEGQKTSLRSSSLVATDSAGRLPLPQRRRLTLEAIVHLPAARSSSADKVHPSPRGGKGLLPPLFGDVNDELPQRILSTILAEKHASFPSTQPCATWKSASSERSSSALGGRGWKSHPKRSRWQFGSRGAYRKLASRCTPIS